MFQIEAHQSPVAPHQPSPQRKLGYPSWLATTAATPILPRQGEVAPKVTEGEDTERWFPLPPPPSGKSQPPPPGGGGSKVTFAP